jgi:hypothetical protein
MSFEIDGTNYLTIAEAAEYLGTTVTKVLMLLRGSDLKGKEIDGEWFVEPESLACCKSHGIDMKAAKSCVSHCSSGGCGCK